MPISFYATCRTWNNAGWWSVCRTGGDPDRHRGRAVQVRIGDRSPSGLGADALLDFSIGVALDGESLTADEQKRLLAADSGLTLLRGKWVEVDHQRLQDALQHWQQLQQQHAGGIDFLRGMRLLAGAPLDGDGIASDTLADWAQVSAGDWLRGMLKTLRDPTGAVDCAGHWIAGDVAPVPKRRSAVAMVHDAIALGGLSGR